MYATVRKKKGKCVNTSVKVYTVGYYKVKEKRAQTKQGSDSRRLAARGVKRINKGGDYWHTGNEKDIREEPPERLSSQQVPWFLSYRAKKDTTRRWQGKEGGMKAGNVHVTSLFSLYTFIYLIPIPPSLCYLILFECHHSFMHFVLSLIHI